MSALTGNQIKNTYQGLLKLADSSTGITSSLQAIQDGLGNNTGVRIATEQIESPNIISYVPLKARYYGTGINQLTAGQPFPSGTQNVILAVPFQDGGDYSYSAMSYYVATATSTSDSVEIAFYETQMISPYGLYPHSPVLSGITLTGLTSTGLKTIDFASPLSFSGYGGGVYFLVMKITNAGVQPTVRFGIGNVGLGNPITVYGLNEGFGGTYGPQLRSNFTAQGYWFSGQTTFDNPFGNLTTVQSSLTTQTSAFPGFLFHTIDAL